MSRVGSGRVGSGPYVLKSHGFGRFGSGQEVLKSRGSGRGGTGRDGAGRGGAGPEVSKPRGSSQEVWKYRGSGRVKIRVIRGASHHDRWLFSAEPRVELVDLAFRFAFSNLQLPIGGPLSCRRPAGLTRGPIRRSENSTKTSLVLILRSCAIIARRTIIPGSSHSYQEYFIT